MRTALPLAALVMLVAAAGLAHAADSGRVFDRDAGRHVKVTVAEPYLELHTGPGRGYPVFRVVARGEQLQVLFRRTDWFKVRDEHDRVGWASRDELRQTLLASGEQLPLGETAKRDFDAAPWEFGLQTGNFGGGNVNSLYLSYALIASLAAEVSVSEALGHASNAEMLLLGLTHAPRPEWRLSPFVELGTGMVHIRPKATIISPKDRTEQIAYYGLGAKYYLSRRFSLRADYRSYVIFTKLANNEDRNEWKAGFAFYF